VRLKLVFGLLAALAGLLPVTAFADMPWPTSSGQSDPYAYQNYLYAGAPGTGTGVIDCNAATTNAPNDLDCNDFKLSGKVDPTVNSGVLSSQELGGVMGPTVDKAWDVTTGRPDIHIAVLDSGIDWSDSGYMHELRDKVALNWAELPPPENGQGAHACASTTLPPRAQKLASPGFPPCYDVNHDGVFNVEDYAGDPRVNPPNHTLFCAACAGPGTGLLTPEDLIEVFTCWDSASDPAGTALGHLVAGTGSATSCDNGAFNIDNDANGFPHDIAGWNFMEHTNDPYDEPHYHHGSGEASDSNAEANNSGDIGTCPSCMVVPLKVGDSFIADVNDFAQAVLYATDNQVSIVQEALGTLDNSALNQAAIDYAYHHGVTVVSSAADEEAGHHNQPASSENHTLVVNSLREDDAHSQVPSQFQQFQLTGIGKTYLSLDGCTNYGGHIDVSIPSTSCSSEATGKSSGMVGLVYSIARNLVKRGLMQQYSPPAPGFPNGVDISPAEVKQIVTMTADDVDFEDVSPPAGRGNSPADATSACSRVTTDPPGHPDNYYGSTNAGSRFASIGGFDQYFGYGRVNANCMVRAVLAGAIPPEVDITSPRWYGNLDPSGGSYAVTGRVAATRASSFTYKVQIAYGVQPHEGDFTTVYTSPTKTGPVSGTLATLSAAQVASIMPAVPGVTPACGTHSVDANGDETDWLAPPYTNVAGSCQNYWDEYTFTLRVQATDNNGRTGEARRSLQAQHDSGDIATGNGAPVAGFPKQLADQFGYSTDGASSPLMAKLYGDNENQLLFGTSSGLVHALHADGSEVPGFPVHATPLCDSQPPDASVPCSQRQHEPAFSDPTVAAVMQHSYAAVLGSVAVGDLDRTGKQEVVFSDLAGYTYAYEVSPSYCAALGHTAPCLRPGFPTHVDFAFSRQGAPPNFNRDHDNRVQFGFIAGPALADLDGDGKLEIIAGALDRHVYVWQPDGGTRPGFPVLLQSPEYVSSIDPGTDRVHLNRSVPYGTKIVSSPAVADLLGDGHKEIVVGRNEEYDASFDGGLNASVDSYNGAFAALGNSPLFSSGNGRVYALYSDGTDHAAQGCTATGHGVPTQAYVCGWPAKVVKFDEELLPTVGSGVDTPPVIMPAADVSCPGDASAGDRVGVFTSDGPPYIFAGDGKSCYGQGLNSSGRSADRVLDTNGVSSGGNTTDLPYLEAVGNAAFGDLSGTGDYVMVAPTAGVIRAADLVLTDHQIGAQDGITAWSLLGVTPGGEPHPHAGFPHFMDDLQFLTGPAIADLNGTGPQQVIEGSATSDLRASTAAGAELPGWSKNTGGWVVATPGVGTIGTDQHQKVAELTREGTLYLWESTAPACSNASWPRYKHDVWDSGNFSTDAGVPATITDLKVTQSGDTATLTFTAPHGDLFCDNAAGYEVRYSSSGPITDANWASATLAGPSNTGGCTYTPQPASAAGQTETITLTGCPAGPLSFDVQAFNDGSRQGGNLGQISGTGGPVSNVPEGKGLALLLAPLAALGLLLAARRRLGRRTA
jgi:hypothetical protein